MTRHVASLGIPVALLAFVSGCQPHNVVSMSVETEPTIAIVDGRVWTGNPEQPAAEAVLVKGNRIQFVGSNEDVKRLAPGALFIDAGGNTVLPGFIDSHVHLLTGGFRLSDVQLRDAAAPSHFIDRIAAFAETLEPGEWVTGGDWDHEMWGGELPHRSWIDAVTPDNPVWVNRLDGHMALANSLALEAAGVAEPVAVVGGSVVVDEMGLTGVLKDNAMTLVERVVPEPSLGAQKRALHAAMDYLASHGVTSVHDMSGEPGTYAALREIRNVDSMRTRVFLAEPLREWRLLTGRIERDGRGDDMLRIGAVKAFVDGSLGSHTAAFHEAYADAPDDRGLLVVDPDELFADMAAADAAGLQLFVHAIGDRANSILLDLFQRLEEANGARDRRPRVEHAQHLRPDDVTRFSAQDVIASMQPYHAIDDGRWAERLIGPDRTLGTYAFRSLIDAGTTVAFGSDWFVAPPIPVAGIYAAVTRRTLDDENPAGWIPSERITVDEALTAYTVNAAYAEFQEHAKGSLVPGKLADIVVLDRDIHKVAAEDIINVSVRLTMVDGQVVYGR